MTTAPAPVHGTTNAEALLDAACRQARVLGARGVVAIADVPLDPSPHPQVVATAVREGGGPRSVVRDLRDAFGAELQVMAVAYLGCRDKGDAGALDREAEAVADSAGAVLIVESEPAEGARWVRPDGLAARCSVRMGSGGGLAPPPLRAAISDHQGKAAGIAAALVEAGHALVEDPSLADVALIDHDVPFHGRLPAVEACVAAGGRAFLYPHGADPANKASWDGLYPISPHLSGSLVLADGHAEIARRYGYPYPVHVVGWPFCALVPRRPARDPRRVLFAPTHPPYLGNPRYPERNREIFRRLLDAPVQITVRHIGTLDENGLWPDDSVCFVQGDMADAPGQIEQIDAADAVVADRSTFGNLAVARGVATVLWDSVEVYNNDASRRPDNLDRYRDLLRYPFDADDGDIWELLRAAARDEKRVARWRERFIGSPLDAVALTSALRGIPVSGSSSRPAPGATSPR